MPAALISWAFDSNSFLIIASKSGSDIVRGSTPSFRNFSRTSDELTAALNSLFSRRTISRGVLVATRGHIHKLESEYGYPAATVVGASGKSARLLGERTASARSLPSLTCGPPWNGRAK